MTHKRFATRKASLALLQSGPSADATVSTIESACSLQFATDRGARFLVKPTAGGATATLRHRARHAAFCSVSTASAPPNDSSRDSVEGSAAGCGGAGLPAHGRSQAAPPSMERLPVAIKKGDQLLPYVWDGRRVVAMSEAALQDSDVTTGRLRNWLQGVQRQLKEAFLPDPRDVTPDYWDWLRWRLSQRFFSSTMQNFSFSALLMATGLGAKKAFAASAAINWLLKDGVSRIVRMTVSTSFGQTFDADLKRMRFITSLIFTACMAGEFATPFWPHHFVALASVSSVGRAIGLSAFVATQPAFQAALATGGNLADLTSKNQAQHMVMDMLALGVSAGLTWLCRGMVRGGLLLPAIMYPICAAGDLTCIWHELKAVQLRSLNRERAEMVIERWIRRGRVPDAAEISAAENLILPSDVWRGVLPLRITPLDRIAPTDPGQLRNLLREYVGEEYVLHVAGRHGAAGVNSSINTGGGWSLPGGVRLLGAGGGGGGGDVGQPELLVSFSDRATPRDIAKALLHAAYLRKAVLDHFMIHGSEPRQHHHKQLHHHGHQGRALSAAPQSPEGIHHYLHHHHRQEHHVHEQVGLYGNGNSHGGGGGSGAAAAAGDVCPERDAGSHHHHHHHCKSGAVYGHTHDHMHWDSRHHMPYRHSHYHTHAIETSPGGHGNVYGNGAAALAAARTASLSLSSQGPGVNASSGNSNNSSSSSSSGGVGLDSAGAQASTVAGRQLSGKGITDDHHHPHRLRGAHPHSSGNGSSCGSSAASSPEPSCWARLDEATWAALVRWSRREADNNLAQLLREAEQAGWKLKPFMLNTTERVQFVRL